MKKKSFILLTCFLLLFRTASSFADRMPEKKPAGYIGAMRVVWCDEWVSLRAEPKKTSPRLAQIPLGSIVYSCMEIGNNLFVEGEYEGQKGYVLKGYLVPAPESEPPLSMAISKRMTMDEVIGNGEITLKWEDYNMSVVAAREIVKEKKKNWEVLRIGCFIDGNPLWGHEERVEVFSQYPMLKAFIGGVEDDWQVMVFDGGYGLSMLDLLSGKERWSVTVGNCPMGNAELVVVDDDGTIYLAGTDGTDPCAISEGGKVLWKSNVSNQDIYDPFEMTLQDMTLQIKYKSGMEDGYKLVTLDSMGELLSVKNQRVKTDEH